MVSSTLDQGVSCFSEAVACNRLAQDRNRFLAGRFCEVGEGKTFKFEKLELSPVEKEGLNSKSLKIFDARVKPRHLRHVLKRAMI